MHAQYSLLPIITAQTVPICQFRLILIRNRIISAVDLQFSFQCHKYISNALLSLVPRPHPSAREKGLVKNDNIPGPEAGIWESQSDRSICN